MKRLFIDLDICSNCPKCVVECSYPYHPQNNGISSIRELATFGLICRQCEIAPCVTSCPKEALEKKEDGVLKRYNMRCISCKTCSLACPFGTIYPELLPLMASGCDYCLGRLKGNVPLCVTTCPYSALKYDEVEENASAKIFCLNDSLAVKSYKWIKEEAKEIKK